MNKDTIIQDYQKARDDLIDFVCDMKLGESSTNILLNLIVKYSDKIIELRQNGVKELPKEKK